MSELAGAVREAIAQGRLAPRVYLYANYHCNLACTYCLTESAPGVARRAMDADVMRALTVSGAELGFTALTVTGGEPFLRPELPALLAELSEHMPVVAMSNATLFDGARISRLDPIAGRDVTLQISLDSAEPDRNDAMRAPDNFARVVETVPRLLDRGIRVRIATTVYDQGEDELTRVAALVGSLGVASEDHVVRATAARGRAALEGLGEPVGMEDLRPEATYTVDGLFWSPFAPTVRGGRLDTDLLVSRQVLPMESGIRALLGLLADGPVTQTSRFTCA